MTENRDFLKEFEELRVETDGIRDALGLNLLSGALKEIMGELKEIRKEIEEGKKENEKKLEELKKENLKIQQQMEEKVSELKNEILKLIRVDTDRIEEAYVSKTGDCGDLKEENLEIQQEIEEKVSELKNEILKLSEKEDFEQLRVETDGMKTSNSNNLASDSGDLSEKTEKQNEIPIREAVLGEWKMVEWQNIQKAYEFFDYDDYKLELFHENLKFELLENGKLMQSGGGQCRRYEGNENENPMEMFHYKELYVEDGRLKSYWLSGEDKEEFHVENGRLFFVQDYDDSVWTRIYEKEDPTFIALRDSLNRSAFALTFK